MEGNAPFPIDQNLSFLNLRKFSRNITSRTRSRSFFHFTLTSRSQFPVIFLSLGLLEKSEWHFYFTLHFLGEVKDIFLHFSLLDCPKPTLAGHWSETQTTPEFYFPFNGLSETVLANFRYFRHGET